MIYYICYIEQHMLFYSIYAILYSYSVYRIYDIQNSIRYSILFYICYSIQNMLFYIEYAMLYRICSSIQNMLCYIEYALLYRICYAIQNMLFYIEYATIYGNRIGIEYAILYSSLKVTEEDRLAEFVQLFTLVYLDKSKQFRPPHTSIRNLVSCPYKI